METLFFEVCFLEYTLQIGGYNNIYQSTLLVMSSKTQNFLGQGGGSPEKLRNFYKVTELLLSQFGLECSSPPPSVTLDSTFIGVEFEVFLCIPGHILASFSQLCLLFLSSLFSAPTPEI